MTSTSSDTTSNILENGQGPFPLADVDITEERRRRRERNAKDENAHDSILATLIHHQRPFSGQIAGPSAKTRYQNSRGKKRRARNMRLRRFRTKAVEMLSTSKRIAQMDVDRRRKLGREIHSASSVGEIEAIALRYLDTSSIFVDTFVANNQEVEESDEEESDEDEDECVICLGAIDHSGMTSLPCNHTFCTVCINSWLENSPTCPTCRHPIRHQSTHVSRRFQRQGRPHVFICVLSQHGSDWCHRKLIYTLVVIILSLLLISACASEEFLMFLGFLVCLFLLVVGHWSSR